MCKKEFSHWNITKVVEHLAKKEKTRNIAHCKFTCSPRTKELIDGKYQQTVRKGARKRKCESITNHYQKEHVDANMDTALTLFSNT